MRAAIRSSAPLVRSQQIELGESRNPLSCRFGNYIHGHGDQSRRVKVHLNLCHFRS